MRTEANSLDLTRHRQSSASNSLLEVDLNQNSLGPTATLALAGGCSKRAG
jgi:hypothetical protein